MSVRTTSNRFQLNHTALTATLQEKRGDEWHDLAVFNADELPPPVRAYCTCYGIRALLADRTSDAKKLGIDKATWMQEIWKDQLMTGEIFAKRTGGKAGAVDPALVQLVCDLKGVDAASATAALQAAGKAVQADLMAAHAEALATIRKAQQGAATVDLGDLLAKPATPRAKPKPRAKKA